jgi:hypothetical protein
MPARMGAVMSTAAEDNYPNANFVARHILTLARQTADREHRPDYNMLSTS